MIFKFRCPKCDVRLTVSEHKAGQSSRCPSCEQSIQIPVAQGDEVSTGKGTASAKTERVAAPAAAMARTDSMSLAPTDESASSSDSTASGGIEVRPAGEPRAAKTEYADAGEFAGSSGTFDRPIPSRIGRDQVLLPRWVIYTQAGLLVIVASTFFVFGMMTRYMATRGGSNSSARTASPRCSSPRSRCRPGKSSTPRS